MINDKNNYFLGTFDIFPGLRFAYPGYFAKDIYVKPITGYLEDIIGRIIFCFKNYY